MITTSVTMGGFGEISDKFKSFKALGRDSGAANCNPG
jgi:hypothetical protein